MQRGQLRPLAVGEVLDVAIKLYRSRFLDLIRLAAVVEIPVQILALIVRISTLPTSTNSTPLLTSPGLSPSQQSQLHSLTQSAQDAWTSAVGTLVAALIGIAATELVVAAAFTALSRSYLGHRESWTRSLASAARRLHSVVWVFLLNLVVSTVALLALIVPGVYLWGSWLVSIPVLLEEDVKGRRALGRSRRLVRRRWWPTIGAYLLGLLLTEVVGAILSSALIAVIVSGSGPNSVMVQSISTVVAILSGVLVTPFTAAVVTVIYFDLRVRKEGLDLELLAREVGVSPSGEHPDFLPPPPPAPGSGSVPPFWPPPPGWRPSPGPPPEGDGAPEV